MKKNEKKIQSLIKEGNECMQNQSWSQGSDIWRELNEILPKNGGILLNLAVCLSHSGSHEEAIEIYNQADKLLPLNPDIAYSQGLNYEYIKDYEQAILAFKRCLKINKNNQDAWIKTALCHRRLQDPETAIGIYKYLLTNFENKIEYVLELASALFEFKKFDEAEDILKQIIENQNDNEIAKKILARVYHNTGRKEEAIELEKEAEGSFTFTT